MNPLSNPDYLLRAKPPTNDLPLIMASFLCTCSEWNCEHDLYGSAVVPEVDIDGLPSSLPDVDLMPMVQPFDLYIDQGKCPGCLCWNWSCGCNYDEGADHSKIVWVAELKENDEALTRTPSDIPPRKSSPALAPAKPALRNQPMRAVKRVSFSEVSGVAFIPTKERRRERYFLAEIENRVIDHALTVTI